MSKTILRGLIAGLIALVMTLPTSALASGVLASNEETIASERAEFVETWTTAMLSRDAAIVEALPHGDAYAHWSPEDRMMAIDELYRSLEENRPADGAPIEDEAEASFVKGFLHGFIFDRAALESSAAEMQSAIEASQLATETAVDAPAVDENARIMATAAPHADMLSAQLAMWSSLREAGPRTPDVLTAVPATPAELAPAFDAINPLLASAEGMSATGTYTLRVVANDQETIISSIPLCAPIPVDADRDGTTGLGGIDVLATLCVSGAPEADADLSEEGILRAIAGGVGPSLTIDRVGAGDADTPDFAPIQGMIIEAYVPLENGRQFVRIGFDTTTTGLPTQARVTLVPAVQASTGAPGALAGAGSVDEASADARATADLVAGAAGVALPWSDVEAIPGEIHHETAPARVVAQQILDDAGTQAETVRGTLDQLLAELQSTAGATVAPVVADANAARREAETAAQPAGVIVDESLAFYGDRANAAVATVDAATRPTVDAAGSDIDAASRPARLVVDEAVEFYTNKAESTITDATNALIAAKANAYATAVTVNREAGLVKNEYVYGDGATGLVPLSVGVDLPQTPVDDEPQDALAAIEGSAGSTNAPGLAPRFGLVVESTGASGDLVVIGGLATREDTAMPFEDDATLILRFTPAPSVVRFFVEPTGPDSGKLHIESATPTTISALLAMRAGERVGAMGMVLGALPPTVDLSFSRSSVAYEASASMDILGFFVYAFESYDDFVSFVEDGTLTGRYAHAIATEIPSAFTLEYEADAGALAFTSTGGRLGALDIAEAAFEDDQLVGFYTHARLMQLPTSFELLAGESAAAFDASEPIGSAEFERTNGPRLASVPPAFVVGYQNGADDLVHLRILGIQRLGLVDERVTMDLAGGYPLVFAFIDGANEVQGQFQSMPNHIEFALARSGEVQTVDVTFLPAGFGLWASMRSPSLGADTAIVAVDDLAGRVIATIVPSGPRVEWQATRITGGVFGGLYGPAGWKASISMSQIPNSMVLSVDQSAQGFPLLGYGASHSTLDVWAYVGPELLTGIGHVWLGLDNIPRLGLGFSISGMTYEMWSKGPERLGRFYMDVSGLTFAVSPISYHNRWVDNWILQVGADLEFAGSITVRHLYLTATNLQRLTVSLTAPTLQMSVDGVLTMAIQTVMHTYGYASLYVRALFGWICIFCYYVSFNRAGEVPTLFHTWTYSWWVWAHNWISYPVGLCSLWSVRIENRWIEIGLRLPNVNTYSGGFSLTNSAATVFVNPGGLVPGNLVYLYALATGFDAYFREYTTRHCT